MTKRVHWMTPQNRHMDAGLPACGYRGPAWFDTDDASKVTCKRCLHSRVFREHHGETFPEESYRVHLRIGNFYGWAATACGNTMAPPFATKDKAEVTCGSCKRTAAFKDDD